MTQQAQWKILSRYLYQQYGMKGIPPATLRAFLGGMPDAAAFIRVHKLLALEALKQPFLDRFFKSLNAKIERENDGVQIGDDFVAQCKDVIRVFEYYRANGKVQKVIPDWMIPVPEEEFEDAEPHDLDAIRDEYDLLKEADPEKAKEWAEWMAIKPKDPEPEPEVESSGKKAGTTTSGKSSKGAGSKSKSAAKDQ